MYVVKKTTERQQHRPGKEQQQNQNLYAKHHSDIYCELMWIPGNVSNLLKIMKSLEQHVTW